MHGLQSDIRADRYLCSPHKYLNTIASNLLWVSFASLVSNLGMYFALNMNSRKLIVELSGEALNTTMSWQIGSP